jgi:hypothetical protein
MSGICMRVPKLIVQRNNDQSLTMIREGGGPCFTLYPQDVEDIKAGKYDPPPKAKDKKEEPAP